MDPEPAAVSNPSSEGEAPSRSARQNDNSGREPEDPFSFRSSSIALVGVFIAIATVGVPLAAVMTDRSLNGTNMVPTALELDGSKPTLPISLTRASKPSGGDSRGE